MHTCESAASLPWRFSPSPDLYPDFQLHISSSLLEFAPQSSSRYLELHLCMPSSMPNPVYLYFYFLSKLMRFQGRLELPWDTFVTSTPA